jgi:hypothetical protein
VSGLAGGDTSGIHKIYINYIKWEIYMELLIIIFTSTVVAAIVTAIFNVIKTILDNKAKTNDSIRLFRYTKLHEILSDYLLKLYTERDKDEELPLIIPNRKNNLFNSYILAKPLVNKEYWENIDSLFEEANMKLI